MTDEKLDAIVSSIKENLTDEQIANLTKDEAKKIYNLINSKVNSMLDYDYDMPEPGPYNYGERIVNRVMQEVGLKFSVDDFSPRFNIPQQFEDRRYLGEDEVPREK